MGCESNHFCGKLPTSIRRRLCAKCSRQLLSAGSTENYVDTRRHAFILVDGLLLGKGYGDTDLHCWPDVQLSRIIVVTPGYLIGFKGVHNLNDDVMFASSYISCVTDCCLARFDQGFLAEITREHREVMKLAAEGAFEWNIAMSEFLGMALLPAMRSKVETLMAFLTRYNLWCSETKLAEILECSRTSVSRAFSVIAKQNPALFDAYFANKNRPVLLQDPA